MYYDSNIQPQEFCFAVHREVPIAAGQKKLIPLFHVPPSSSRQLQSEIKRLPRGRYLIVPSSMPSGKSSISSVESAASTRLPLSIVEAEDDNGKFTPVVLDAYREVFLQLDTDRHGYIPKIDDVTCIVQERCH